MKDEDPGYTQDPLDEHRLPGTNQAGKGSRSRKGSDRTNKPGGAGTAHQDQLEEHSLPGTNQAGEGPGSCDKKD